MQRAFILPPYRLYDRSVQNLRELFVTLEEYMKVKFGNKRIKALSNRESSVLGIELTKGWFKRNKDMVLTQHQINKLVQYNHSSSNASGKRKTRLRELLKDYSDWSGQYLYLMRNEIGRYKIGVSQDPVNRAWSITTGSGLFTTVLCYWSVDKVTTDVEAMLLKHYKKYNTYGEWFSVKIDADDVEKVMQGYCNYKRSYMLEV